MHKFKRFTAFALAATMVVGGSVTAFAEEAATSGSATGTGTSEGHVDKHVVSVTLPTIASGSTPFAYTMDLERLIQGTQNAKYNGASFPAADADTGVYFLSSANTYTNTSEELTVTSESSDAVKLTVDVEVESADTDIALVDSAPAADVTEPQLYLALKVGDTVKPVKKGEKVSAEVDIAGVPSNFKTAVDNGKYVYSAIGSTDAGFTAWNTSKISMTGAVSKASAEGLTAPTLKVTWSWTDPAANAAPSIATDSYTMASGSDVAITLNYGKGNLAATGIKAITFVAGGETKTCATSNYQVSGNTLTILGAYTSAMISNGITSRDFTVVFNDTVETSVTVTLATE